MTKSYFKKVAAPWMVSWKFLVIFEYSSISGQLYLKVAADKLVLRTMQFISFVYIATLKVFWVILSALFVLQEIVLYALVSWKL